MAIIKIVNKYPTYQIETYYIPNLPRLDFNVGDTLYIKEVCDKPLKIIRKHHMVKLINPQTFDRENHKSINISQVGGFTYDYLLHCEIV